MEETKWGEGEHESGGGGGNRDWDISFWGLFGQGYVWMNGCKGVCECWDGGVRHGTAVSKLNWPWQGHGP